MDIAAQIVPFLLIVVVFIFLFWMPQRRQQKEQQDFWNKLKAGDRVLMNSGIIGKVVKVREGIVTLEISPDVKIDCLLQSINRPAPEKGAKTA